MRPLVTLSLLAACHGGTARTTLALREACDAAQYWDGAACRPRGDAAAQIARGKEALSKGADVEAAQLALDAAERDGGPRDHEANILLWQQRGIAAAYVDDDAAAAAAFDMLLALDPSHILSYRLSTKATFVFEDVRRRLAGRGVPAIDVRWASDQKVGERIPIDVEVVADPKQFLRRATLFMRARGEPRWRAADLALPASHRAHLVLPPVQTAKPVSLELYLRAYDDRRNEVLAWADPKQPREIPLRYEPPPPWYRRPWVWITGGSALAAGTGLLVYAFTIAPPDRVSGSAIVK
ncbi:MAG TPA: hypothetical protein VN253_02855 [Kofleriaceae bacterium]|nr:hypothetical protein [Kofleriaceae bacterium]